MYINYYYVKELLGYVYLKLRCIIVGIMLKSLEISVKLF